MSLTMKKKLVTLRHQKFCFFFLNNCTISITSDKRNNKQNIIEYYLSSSLFVINFNLSQPSKNLLRII